jgi:serine protease Do
MPKTVTQIAEQAGPAVIGLTRGARGGSGVVIAPGRALTLARNLRGEEVGVHFSDDREETARLLGSDGDLRVALLAVETGDAPALAWSEQGTPKIGSPVFALADPAGRGLRATAGAVAATPRSLRGARGRLIEGAIEHTAPLPRGSGGGPLLDGAGALLGLNAVRLEGGLILALPATALRERVEALAAGRAPAPRQLGVAIAPARAARRLRAAVGLPERDGLLVRSVRDDTLAARAGVQRGDLIVALDGREVASVDALLAALDGAPADKQVPLRIVRGSDEQELAITMEQR